FRIRNSPVARPRDGVSAINPVHPLRSARAGSVKPTVPEIGGPGSDNRRAPGTSTGRKTMKKTLVALGMTALMSTTAMAETIGVSMARFDDNFLTVLRNGMDEYAKGLEGVDIQIEDATDDVGK